MYSPLCSNSNDFYVEMLAESRGINCGPRVDANGANEEESYVVDDIVTVSLRRDGRFLKS